MSFFMKNTYLKIELGESIESEKSNLLRTLLGKFLSTIIPKANPDFENEIQNINTWSSNLMKAEFQKEKSV